MANHFGDRAEKLREELLKGKPLGWSEWVTKVESKSTALPLIEKTLLEVVKECARQMDFSAGEKYGNIIRRRFGLEEK